MTWRQIQDGSGRIELHQRLVNAESAWWQSRATADGRPAPPVVLADLAELARAVRQGWTAAHNRDNIGP